MILHLGPDVEFIRKVDGEFIHWQSYHISIRSVDAGYDFLTVFLGGIATSLVEGIDQHQVGT